MRSYRFTDWINENLALFKSKQLMVASNISGYFNTLELVELGEGGSKSFDEKVNNITLVQ
jgi:hypothetical protein